MQVLAMTLMEPPGMVDAEGIRDEKVKALRAGGGADPRLCEDQRGPRPVRQRMERGCGRPGYRQEPDVDPQSQTETYVRASPSTTGGGRVCPCTSVPVSASRSG